MEWLSIRFVIKRYTISYNLPTYLTFCNIHKKWCDMLQLMTTNKKPDAFGKRLRSARKRAHLTQQEMLEALKAKGFTFSQGAMSHYETGRNYPDPDLMAAMAEVAEVSLDWLAGLTATDTPVAELEETAKAAQGAGKINRIMDGLSKERQKQVLDFAEYLLLQERKKRIVPPKFDEWAAATEVLLRHQGEDGEQLFLDVIASDYPDIAEAFRLTPKKKLVQRTN